MPTGAYTSELCRPDCVTASSTVSTVIKKRPAINPTFFGTPFCGDVGTITLYREVYSLLSYI